MTRTRLIFLGLLAVVAVGVVASASAGEPPKKCGGKVEKTPNYCVEGLQLENSKGESAPASVEGTDGVSVFTSTIGTVKTEVECKGGKTTGSIENGSGGSVGKSKITNTFEGCKLLKPANCKLTSAQESKIKTTELKGTLALTSGRVEDKLETIEGSAFASISIEGKENSCVIAEPEAPKTFNVTGFQLCEADKTNAEVETEATNHKIICKASLGGLKIGSNGAEMASEETLKLTSGKKWSVKESI